MIFRYLWGECLSLWHFYCGFLSPICTIYKENGNIYEVRNGAIPALCGVPSLLQPLPPFASLPSLGMSCRCDFNMSLLRGRTHSRLTIAFVLDCHCILDYLFYKFVKKKKKTKNIVGWGRETGVPGSHPMLGDCSGARWVRSSEFSGFLSRVFAGKSTGERG